MFDILLFLILPLCQFADFFGIKMFLIACFFSSINYQNILEWSKIYLIMKFKGKASPLFECVINLITKRD